MLTYFLKDISNRLNLLVGNARLLPEDLPLDKTVEIGNDEIAYLDSVLREASEKLLEAKQNRQSFMNMITQDIRSPLMSSDLLIEIVSSQAQENNDEKSLVATERLRRTYSKVVMLIEDLLLLEKGETQLNLDLGVADLDKLCASAVETVLPQAKSKGIKVTVSVEAEQVIVDKLRLEQVLNNLLSNAIRFTDGGGTVSIVSEKSSEAIKVSIQDSGCGIPADEISQLFDKFFQSSNSTDGKGFGLGLSIAKMIVENHEGKIGVKSEVGKGSPFWFTLPLEG